MKWVIFKFIWIWYGSLTNNNLWGPILSPTRERVQSGYIQIYLKIQINAILTFAVFQVGSSRQSLVIDNCKSVNTKIVFIEYRSGKEEVMNPIQEMQN